MQLSVIGLNHQTAPLDIRAKLAFPAQELEESLNSLCDTAASEAVILSTCNRTEIYCVGDGGRIIEWLAQNRGLNTDDVRPYLYHYGCGETIRHAFRVACGLDSMVLGEPQILGQMKEAVRVAQSQKRLGTWLNALFQRTFATAKDVRSHTSVGDNVVSMASASVRMAEQIFPDIADLNVLFVGAGEMIELVATYFAARNPKNITIANRSLPRAQSLCDRLNSPAQAVLLTDLADILHRYDVVVSSTASPLPVIGKGMVEKALAQRGNMPVFMLDLAVPRDIEPQVTDLEDIYLYTVDDMVSVVESGKEARTQAAEAAEVMVNEKVGEFIAWQKARQRVPLICALRDEGERHRQYVLNNAMKQLAKGVPAEQVLERLSVQLTNKLLHSPTRALNKAGENDALLVDTLTQVFHLDEKVQLKSR